MFINYPKPTIIHNTDLQKSKQINFIRNKSFDLGLKKHVFSGWFLIVLLFVFLSSNSIYSQTTDTYTTPGNGSWVVPCGVTSITVQVWGAGGAGGGSRNNNRSGEGGGAGGFSTDTFSVTAGQTIPFTIGSGGNGGTNNGVNGENSSILSLTANGGNGGDRDGDTTRGFGGSASGGTTNLDGGNGAAGAGSTGGNGGNAPAGGGTGGLGNSNGNGFDGNSPGGGGGGGEYNGSNRAGGDGGNGQVRITYTAETYLSELVSMSYGSSTWCTGETRNVTVQIKNIGTATWTDGSPDINIGVKWNTNGANWDDYYVRVNAGNLAPGATGTYVLAITAKNATVGPTYTTDLAAGSNNLTFDVVYENVSWFGNNNSCVGPGNTTFVSPAINIVALPATPNNPTSNSPQCVSSGVTLTRSGTVPGGQTFYWQGTNANGTSTANSAATYNAPTSGTYYIRAQNNTTGCWSTSSGSRAVVVNPNNTVGVASSTPTLCINTALTNITHTTTGATGISNNNVLGANGLPAGVKAVWASNTITISGTPTASGTFNYSIPLTGGCGTFNATGTIIITPNNTTGIASSTPTLCINSSLTAITHTTTGATSISNNNVAGANGLPAGVKAVWAANIITISGTPTVSGTFNYSIPLTGGCGSVNATGTITVLINTAGSASSTPTLCINTVLTAITHTTTGATGISNSGVSGANGLPAGVSATWSANTITINGTPTTSGTFNYSIPLTGGCGLVNATGTISVTPNKTVGGATSTPTLCINTVLTNITHTTTGANGISNNNVTGANGLPAGVKAVWAANTITISGTPTASGTFNYSIPLTGGCGSANATGTIIVTPNNTAGIASSTPTLCINSALASITHTTTGATSISNNNVAGANGLPAGVKAVWTANIITISGTPTVSGTFNYSIPLTGGCGSVNATGTITVLINTAGSASSTPTLCINTVLTAITHTTTGATGISDSGVSGANGLPVGVSATWSANTITINGTPTTSGTFNYSIPLTGGCGLVNATGTISVTPNKTVGGATSTPTLCINTVLTNITHTTTGATSISNNNVTGANGLPAGVKAVWAANTITISGTPTASGTFNYSIPLTGGCGSANATGTIIVTPNNTAGIASSTPTLCINSALTGITHTTIGATGISNSGVSGANGLPAGVSANWSANTITISGTPTASGTFNYAIPLTGGCGSVNATGTITVLINTVGSASSTPTLCINTVLTAITHTTTGATGISNSGVSGANGLPAGVSATWSANTITINGTPTASGSFSYAIPLTGGCGNVNATGTITVTPNNTAGIASSTPTLCANNSLTNITHTTTGATGISNNNVFGANGLPAGVKAVWAANTITISGTPTASGTFNYSIPLIGGCGNINATGTITVNENPTIALSSAAATTSQNICMNTLLTPITYIIGGSGTGATVTGLPTGIIGNYASGIFTISGTPTVAGTFNYNVTTTGGFCPAVGLGGNIIVKPLSSTISLTSAAGTDNQYICRSSVLTNITYAIGGSATGASVTGLPTGISGNFASGVFTISGTPSVSGTFNYTVSTIGGCTTGVNTTGTIKVEPRPLITLTSGVSTTNQNICINTTFDAITYSIGGSATSATVTGLPTGITGSYTGGIFTISGTPTASGTFNYTVTSAGSSYCTPITSTGTIQVDALPVITLSSLPATTNQTICINSALTNITYSLGGGASGATVTGLPTGVTGNVNGAGTILTISGTPTVSGTFNYTVTTTGGTCTSVNTAGTIIVQPLPIITLTSAAATTNQTICINTSLTSITYNIGGSATSATVSGLPTGVTGNFSGGIFTINGTPTVSGTFNYTVTSAGGPCNSVTSNGTIKVDALPIITRTSAVGTTNQTICINNLLTNITYSLVGGATGATVSGLPTGVTGSINGAGTIFTISGNPTVSGTFNYIVTKNGGSCSNTTATGTIIVQPIPVITLTSAVGTDNQTVCISKIITPITYSIGGSATGATVSGLPTGVTGNFSSGTFTVTGTPSVAGTFNYTVTSSGGTCSTVTKTGTIKVDVLPVITRTSALATATQTLCMNNTITNITYSLTGSATGATVAGLPAGVTGNVSGTTLTISGSPSVSGTFNYTVTTTGGACTGATATGSINVNPLPNIEISSDYCTVPGKVKLVATSNIVGTTWLWSTGATTSTIEIDIVGLYTVTGTTPVASGGCSATASINVANELVIDGTFTNFNAAAPSFYTEYSQNQPFYTVPDTGLWPEGTYAVNTSAYSPSSGVGYHPYFQGKDHTNNSVGARNFLMINGAATLIADPPGPDRVRTIWQQTVSVAPGTSYYFSAWGMNLNPSSPAQLQFEVNGVAVGSIADLNLAPKPSVPADVNLTNWVRFYSTSLWNSGAATTAVIRIINLNPDPGGNDFGLDDISFGTLLPFIKLTSAIGTDAQTVCQNYNITPISYAIGGGIAGPTVTGLPAGITQVYTNGVLTLSGAPTATGTFSYSVSTTGTCSTVTVNGTMIVKPTPVQPILGAVTQPTCATATGSFAITNYNSGYIYAASPSAGVTITGGLVTAPAGNYTITATLSGCTSVASANATVNVQPATPAQPNLSTVTQPTCTVATGSFTIINYNATYTYTISPSTGVSRTGNTVTAPAGTYSITATLGICTSVVSANRTINTQPATPIQPTLGTVTQPTCASATGSFTITNHNPAYTYAATPSAGVTISGATVTAPAGNYTITATLVTCTSVASLSITVNPQPFIPAQPTLSTAIQPTCTVATGSFTINNYDGSYTYTISPSLGVTRTGNTVTAPAGTYSITATFGACTSTSASRTINAQPATPVQPTLSAVTPPSCTTPTGSFTITNYNASYTYAATPSGGVSIVGSTVTAGVGNYTIKATLGLCTSVASASASVVSSSKTWTGSVSTDWNDDNNWNPIGVPTATQSVLIPNTSRSPEINSAALSCSLTIQNGANLTVTTNNSITVTNDVNVLGTSKFILEDSASLIQVNNVANTVTGTFSMTRITQPMYRYDYTYWGSPLTLSSDYTLGDLTPDTRPDKYYSWIPTVSNGSGNWKQESVATVMNPLMGYIARAPDTYSTNPSIKLPYTAVFTGTPNNGDIAAPVSCGTLGNTTQDDKWNLLGNPYPSAIDALTFLTANTNIDGTVSLWTHGSAISASNPNPFYGDFTYNYSEDDMLIYNASGSLPAGFSGKIASGQGFMISMLPGCTGLTTSVNFTNSMRSSAYTNANFYKSANKNGMSEKNRIWLSMVDKNKIATGTMVGYIEGATNENDRLYDALADVGITMKIYSIVDTTPLSIQGRAIPFDATEMVPLGMKLVTSGTYSIAIDQLDGLFDTQAIYLEDKLMNVIHDIKLKQYDFVSETGTFNDRFLIRYTPNNDNSLDVKYPTTSITTVIALITKDKINIQASENIKKVEVFDVAGKLVKSYKPKNSNKTFVDEFIFSDGVYFAKIKLENGMIETRKLANGEY